MRIYLYLLLFILLPDWVSGQVLLLDGLGFTEGPVIDENGDLYFSDIQNNRIYFYYNDKLSVFLENSGGANGLFFNDNGVLIACATTNRQVISITKTGKITVLADKYNGKKLNSPNDLWIHPNGGIYFTDPRFGNTDNMEQDGMHVYYLSPKGKLTRVINDLVRPNGIAGSMDGNYLFVVDQAVEKTYKYKIKGNGLLKNRKIFAEFGTNGLSVDNNENVYITNGKKIDLYDYAGDLIKSYNFPSITTNVTWSKKETFVTTQNGQIFVIR